MTMSADAQQRIEAYLGKLRRRLRGMNDAAVRDIVEELRSHITDRVGAGELVTATEVDEALARLGSPEELASQYITDDLLARAEVRRSPFRILASLFRWASLSVAGLLVLLGSIVGYGLAAAFILAAVLKPLHPRTAGLWVFPDGAGDSTISLRLGVVNLPPQGRELLGWW